MRRVEWRTQDVRRHPGLGHVASCAFARRMMPMLSDRVLNHAREVARPILACSGCVSRPRRSRYCVSVHSLASSAHFNRLAVAPLWPGKP